jgi:hypothetical protein
MACISRNIPISGNIDIFGNSYFVMIFLDERKQGLKDLQVLLNY